MSDNLMEKLEGDAKQETQMSMSELYALAAKQIEAEGALAAAKLVVKEKTKELNALCLVTIPDAMQNAKLADFTLGDGRKITLKNEMTCSVPAKRKAEIIAKLIEDDAEHLVARTMVIDMGKGTVGDNSISTLQAQAEEMGFTAAVGRDVNTASLKAYLRKKNAEAGEKGETFDLGFYGAYEVRKTKIS